MNDIKLPEPVAYRHMHDDGWEYYDAPTGEDCIDCESLYTSDQLRTAIAAERANDIHSCHPNCARAGCVNERLRFEVESLRADADIGRELREKIASWPCPTPKQWKQIQAAAIAAARSGETT